MFGGLAQGACLLIGALSGLSLPVAANAAESCNTWRDTCLSRTQGDESFCGPKVEECRRTGCFTEGKRYGGAMHCGLGPSKAGKKRSPSRAAGAANARHASSSSLDPFTAEPDALQLQPVGQMHEVGPRAGRHVPCRFLDFEAAAPASMSPCAARPRAARPDAHRKAHGVVHGDDRAASVPSFEGEAEAAPAHPPPPEVVGVGTASRRRHASEINVSRPAPFSRYASRPDVS